MLDPRHRAKAEEKSEAPFMIMIKEDPKTNKLEKGSDERMDEEGRRIKTSVSSATSYTLNTTSSITTSCI